MYLDKLQVGSKLSPRVGGTVGFGVLLSFPTEEKVFILFSLILEIKYTLQKNRFVSITQTMFIMSTITYLKS